MTNLSPGALAWSQDRSIVRYPDPAVETVDPRFEQYRLGGAAVERLWSGGRWTEGAAKAILLETRVDRLDRRVGVAHDAAILAPRQRARAEVCHRDAPYKMLSSIDVPALQHLIHHPRCPGGAFAGARAGANTIQRIHNCLDQRLLNVRRVIVCELGSAFGIGQDHRLGVEGR